MVDVLISIVIQGRGIGARCGCKFQQRLHSNSSDKKGNSQSFPYRKCCKDPLLIFTLPLLLANPGKLAHTLPHILQGRNRCRRRALAHRDVSHEASSCTSSFCSAFLARALHAGTNEMLADVPVLGFVMDRQGTKAAVRRLQSCVPCSWLLDGNGGKSGSELLNAIPDTI